MPRYVTADALAGIPTLAGVPTAEYRRVLDDAGDLLGFLAEHPWCTDGELRSHYEQADWPPDRLNLALGVLRDTDHVLVLELRHQAVLEPPVEPADG